jgi:acyl-coenzyme A thioesterase PaaI-like protein
MISLQKAQWGLRAFGLTKVLMLGFLNPKVLKLDETQCAVMIKLSRRSRNHLNSMYFGALAAGADCAAGLMAMMLIWEEQKKSKTQINLVFQDFKADFHKRADGDVVFTSTQGAEIAALVKQAATGNERVSLPVKVIATIPSQYGTEPVAEFVLTLSLKKRVKE